MAERLLEGVLGGEEEKIDPTVGGAGPLAVAIATNFANQSPEVAAETVAFLRQQTSLLRIQQKNLDVEYEEALKHGRIGTISSKRARR